MPTARRVAVLVGSLRKGSLNRKVALALPALAPASLTLEIVEIGDLPHYNQDDDANPPATTTAFKQGRRAPTPSSSSRPNTTARCPAC